MALQDRKRARRLSINNRELLFAATDGNLDKIKKLINDGADLNFADRDGNTPLHWAVESGNKKVVDFLVTKGASAKHKNVKNETPADVGKRIERQDIVKILDPPQPPKTLITLPQSPKKVFEFPLSQSFLSEVQVNDTHVSNENKQVKRLNNPVHGHIYQLKVLMLFLYRGIAHEYSFRLGSEIRDAKKFDDLVFEYTKGNQKIYRLLQAKHKLDESKKITADDLLCVTNGDYNLIKYFVSYQESKNAELFKDGLIEDVTICTNIDFDMKSLESNRIIIEEIIDKDEISDVKSDHKKPIRYKFNGNIIKMLKSALQNYRLPRLTRTIEYSDNDMRDFLNRLVFAVNQPNEEELGCIVKDEISKEFDFFTEDVYNKFFITMLDWLQGKGKGLFLSSEEGKRFFEDMNKGIQFWFDVKPPTDSFTGRTKKLNDLHKLLTDKGKGGESQLVCITGLGGVGKSELAKKYISQRSQDYDNKVVWLNAESYESLAKSFRRLACDQLRISLKNADNEDKKMISVVEDVYRFFSQRKCLFVFDNAEKYKSQTEYDNGIDRFLPADRKRLHVLITSRNQNWPSSTRVMPLSVFDEVEAIAFIKKSLNLKKVEKEEDVADIANELQFFPLALQQAVAYIKKQNEKLKNIGLAFEINEYLEKYRSKTKQFLSSEFSEDNDNDYAKTIYSTWNVTLDAIRQKENGAFACEILEMLSFFAPSDIPVQTVINLVNGDVEVASDAIQLLKQYSMINVENKIIYLHRLVQQVTRLHVQDEKREEEMLFKALQSFSRENLNSENVEHATSLWNYANKYENLLIEFFQLPSYISSELLKDARYEETRIFGIKVSELLRNLPSRDLRILVGILAVKNSIGQALLEQGKHDAALAEFVKVLTIQEHYFGPDHPENMAVKSNIALALKNQGRYEMALELYYEILRFEENTKGKSHSDVFQVKYDIGTVLTIRGKYKEALKMLEEVLSNQETMLGKNHDKTLKTKTSIAAVLFHLDRYHESLKLYKETLTINESRLPRHHPDILAVKSNIAGILMRQREYNNSLKLYKEVYEITIEAYGESHPDVLSCRRHMAEIFRGQGKVSESLQIYEEVFQQQMRLLGGNHPDTINTQYSIAQVLHIDHKHYSAALHAYEALLEKCQMILGDKNSLTLRVRVDIAEILMQQKKYDEAKLYYQQVYVIRKDNLGEEHPDTLRQLNSIGLALQHQGRSEESLKLFRECYKKICNSSPDHPDALGFKQNIGHALYSQQKYDEALKIFREVLEVQEKNHPSSTAIKNKIAAILQSKRNDDLAAKMSRKFSKSNEGYDVQMLDVHLPFETDEPIETLSAVAKDSLTSVKSNNLEKLENLLKKGVDVNTADDDGITLLHYAVNNGNLGIVNTLLNKKADVTKVSKKGNTPLHVATLKGHKEILETLLKHANPKKLHDFVNVKTTTSGATALHVAAKNGSLDFVRLLLKHNAIHNILNHKCETPLYVSTSESVDRLLLSIEKFFEDAKKGEAKILDKLSAMKPDELTAILNARDMRGNTLLQVSIINKHNSVSSGLLKFMKK